MTENDIEVTKMAVMSMAKRLIMNPDGSLSQAGLSEFLTNTINIQAQNQATIRELYNLLHPNNE